MSSTASLRRLAAAGLGLLTLGVALPVQAVPKPPKVTVSASAVRDPASRLCMPRTLLGKDASRDLPKTICQTRDEWTAQGVTIVVK